MLGDGLETAHFLHHLSFATPRQVMDVLLGMVTALLDSICVPECLGTESVVSIGGRVTVVDEATDVASQLLEMDGGRPKASPRRYSGRSLTGGASLSGHPR